MPDGRQPEVDPSLSATIAPIRLPGMATVAKSIRIRGLNYWYGHGEGRSQALTDITLEVGRGEVVILTGPSGSGKTTLLTIIGSLRRADEGSVTVIGRDLRALSVVDTVAFRRQIGFIFQSHNLFNSLTAIENVRMATALRPATVAEMNRRAAGMLTRVGLGDRLRHRPAQLSGGQSQRVAIARALVNEPALVLADEPTASLDAKAGQDVLSILHELASGPTHSTVLIVTHDQRVLDRADRIVNLVGGRIVSNVMPRVSIRIVKTLRKVPEMADYNPSMLALFADAMLVELHQPGDVLAREGAGGDRLYMIGQGEAETLRDGVVVRTLKEGDFFGTTSVDKPRLLAETLRARTDLEVFVMTRDNLRRVMSMDKDVEERVRLSLMSRQ
jgi:putative ABC transport system ATP-binding protein